MKIAPPGGSVRRITTLIAGVVLLASVVTVRSAGAALESPRCTPSGLTISDRTRFGGTDYSLCSFRWAGSQISVLAARIGGTMRFVGFGHPGRDTVASRMLYRGGAVAGTNGDFVAPVKTTKNPWYRDGVEIAPGIQAGSAFVEDDTGAYIGPAQHLYADHPGVTDGFGGFPLVVEDGENIGSLTPPQRAGGDNPFWDANPRTAIGVSHGCEDGDIATACIAYLVTVDGRQGAYSRGVEFPALGSLMLHLGSWDAMNTDGGGSTEMWMRGGKPRMCESDAVGGCILDRPSTGVERTVVQSIGLIATPQ